MRKFLKIVLWYPAAIFCLGIALSTYYRLTYMPGGSGLIRQEFHSFSHEPVAFAALPAAAFEIKTAFAAEDARPLVINHYLKYYNSPMSGMGDYIVKTADHFHIDPYLIVAIAQQESNLGKITPPDCYNAWGWGIHSAGTLCFSSWTEGINAVTQGLSEKYLAYGLTTPEKIMSRYNPQSPGGAWAKGVQQFLDDLNTGSW